MIKEYHGKRYYMEFNNYDLLCKAIYTIEETNEFPALKGELFWFRNLGSEEHWVLYSDSKVETFRGSKYHDWERFKRYVYKLKKELESV